MLYSDNQVQVDTNFVRSGSKSFAINKINSVEIRAKKTAGSWAWIIYGIILLLFLPGMIASFFVKDEAGGAGDGQIFLFILVAIFGALFYRSFNRRKSRRTFELYLMTSSGEVQAFMTQDRSEIDRLRDAIEVAMAQH
jgi:hypothetical protein